MSDRQLRLVAITDSKKYSFEARWNAACQDYWEMCRETRSTTDESFDQYMARVGHLLKEDWLMYYYADTMEVDQAYAKLEELRAELKRKEGEE
jgi:hypothetical protein